jgi:hypothetical protein
MKKYRVIFLVPEEKIIEATDPQRAHNYVTRLLANPENISGFPYPTLHSIVELEEPVAFVPPHEVGGD